MFPMTKTLRTAAAAILAGVLGTACAQTAPSVAAAKSKANVVVLATGGTIAGAGAPPTAPPTRPRRCRSTS